MAPLWKFGNRDPESTTATQTQDSSLAGVSSYNTGASSLSTMADRLKGGGLKCLARLERIPWVGHMVRIKEKKFEICIC